MTYEVNPIGSDLTDAEVLAALSSSLETWDLVIGGSFELFDNTLTITTDTSGDDGKNTISWADLSDGVIAQNRLAYNLYTGEIVESDVTFNTDYLWSTSESCPDNKMDLKCARKCLNIVYFFVTYFFTFRVFICI